MQCLTCLKNLKTMSFWLGGETNLPGIDWKTGTFTGHSYSVSINQTYKGTFNHVGCEQMLNFPTRIDNILDGFYTNRSSIVDRFSPKPELSDHDIVLARYKKVQKDAQNKCRNAHNEFIRNMVTLNRIKTSFLA